MTKQEKIIEAYGEHWEIVKNNINENGFCDNQEVYRQINKVLFDTHSEMHIKGMHYLFRPKSLQGIETNNGWIKIESEADLPKGIESKKITFRNKEGTRTTYFSEDIVSEIPNHFLRYSHWRYKKEFPEPIY